MNIIKKIIAILVAGMVFFGTPVFAARDFDGTNDKMTMTLPASAGSQMTIAHWIYPDSVAQYANTIKIVNGSNITGALEFDDGWGYVFAYNFTGTDGRWSVAKPTTGSWQHYAVTYNNGATTNDPIIYKNGSSVGIIERSTPTLVAETAGTSLQLGMNSDVYWYDGRMAEVAIWNRILSATEIAGLGKGFSPKCYSRGLIYYSPFVRNVADYRNGIAITDAGTVAIAHPRIIYCRN